MQKDYLVQCQSFVRKKLSIHFKRGEVLEVHVTDKGALTDIPAWAKAGGHTIVDTIRRKWYIHILIKKALKRFMIL